MRWSFVGIRTAAVAAVAVTGAGLAIAPASAASQHVGNGVSYMKPFNASDANKAAHGHGGGGGGGTTSNNLYYHGGVNGIGVETAPKVYLVFWGSQWGTRGSDKSGNDTFTGDPTGEAGIIESFYKAAGNTAWLSSVAQYCQGVPSGSGTSTCTVAANKASDGVTFGSSWYDDSAPAPSRAGQSQLASEALKAISHFPGINLATEQIVVATPHGFDPSGFGTQYCAWHSSASTGSAYLAYTNLPYMTDGGTSCGANFNQLGPNAGITIVGGHEMAETITDQIPNGGWLDTNGAENGDKCAWITTNNPGASASVSLNGQLFPVQSLWSNAISGCAGT